ncbi:hypothetical protein AB0G00_35005 [Nocardia salmonicida]
MIAVIVAVPSGSVAVVMIKAANSSGGLFGHCSRIWTCHRPGEVGTTVVQ